MKKIFGLLLILLCLTPAALAREADGFEYYLQTNGDAVIIGFAAGSETKDLVIPAQLDGHPVSLIISAAFLDADIVSVHLPANLARLDPSSFSICNDRTALTVAEDHPVFEMKNGVLFDKTTQTLVFYPPNRKGKSYTVPKGTLAIGDQAFKSARGLTKITLPKGLQRIGEEAFYNASFSKITLPNSLTEIGTAAFASCYSLKELKLPPNVSLIHGNPLPDTNTKVKVDKKNPVFKMVDGMLIDTRRQWLIMAPHRADACAVPEGVTHIAPQACAKIWATSVTLPESLESIGREAFFDARGLQKAELPQGLKEIGERGFSWSGIKSITIPSGVTAIGERVFDHCANLSSLTLCEGLERIGAYAFNNCSELRQVTLPSTLQYLSKSAFEGCDVQMTDLREAP